jgi:hypothetical protein
MGTGSPKSVRSDPGSNSGGPILRALFDLSFSRFLSLELVKILYVVAIFLAVLAVIPTIVIAFDTGFWTGVISIFVAPFLFLIYIVSWRVWLELLIVLFRIAEYAREIAENTSILGRRDSSSDTWRR